MKKMFFVAVLVVLFSGASWGIDNAPNNQNQNIGRFQVIKADDFPTPNGKMYLLLLVDTATGKTRMFAYSSEGRPGWSKPIPLFE